MDPTRFDALARSLTRLTAHRRPSSRRRLLRMLGGGLLTGGLATAQDAMARKGKKRRKRCKGGKTRCGKPCVDLNADPLHCGTCDKVCDAGQTCRDGLCGSGCTPNCAGKACGASDDCGGQCSNGSCPDGQTCGGGGTPNQCGEGCTPSCADKECGGDGCGGTCGPLGGNCPAGQTCRDNGTCIDSGGNNCDPPCPFNEECQGGVCVAAPNRCSPAFVCSGFGGPAPVCGSVAGGGTCGCFQSTEGNNVCLNESANGADIDGGTLQACSSSQDCRDTVGFHFYCRKPLANENGLFCGQSVGRCWPECDSPNVTSARHRRQAKSRAKRGRRG